MLAPHVVAFARSLREQRAVTVVPRFALTLLQGELRPPLGDIWGDTMIEIPEAANTTLHNVLTGDEVTIRADGRIKVAEVLQRFPAALLTSAVGQ